MGAVDVVFPSTKHLLCMWHIEKNIMAKLKPKFRTAEAWTSFLEAWTTTAMSDTEDGFHTNWDALVLRYGSSSYEVRYLTATWMQYKERFVPAWTNRYMHLGSTTSSRAEGAHATIKRYLQVSTGNLDTVCRRISLAVTNQEREMQATRATQLIRVPHVLRQPHVFGKVLTKISTFALLKVSFTSSRRSCLAEILTWNSTHTLPQVFDQWKQVMQETIQSPLPPCASVFTTTLGMPCAHVLRRHIRSGTQLAVDDFHRQWWLVGVIVEEDVVSEEQVVERFGVVENILSQLSSQYVGLAPHQQVAVRRTLQEMLDLPFHGPLSPLRQERTRGRPIGATNRRSNDNSSTRREPSGFELVRGAGDRRCALCRQSGHNRRTCPNRTTWSVSNKHVLCHKTWLLTIINLVTSTTNEIAASDPGRYRYICFM